MGLAELLSTLLTLIREEMGIRSPGASEEEEEEGGAGEDGADADAEEDLFIDDEEEEEEEEEPEGGEAGEGWQQQQQQQQRSPRSAAAAAGIAAAAGPSLLLPVLPRGPRGTEGEEKEEEEEEEEAGAHKPPAQQEAIETDAAAQALSTASSSSSLVAAAEGWGERCAAWRLALEVALPHHTPSSDLPFPTAPTPPTPTHPMQHDPHPRGAAVPRRLLPGARAQDAERRARPRRDGPPAGRRRGGHRRLPARGPQGALARSLALRPARSSSSCLMPCAVSTCGPRRRTNVYTHTHTHNKQIIDMLLRAWPFGQSTREVGFLQLLGGVLAAAPLLHHIDDRSRVPLRAFARVAACLRSPHAAVAEEALLTCSNPRLINLYIAAGAPGAGAGAGAGPTGGGVPGMVREALSQNLLKGPARHWSPEVRVESRRLLEMLTAVPVDLETGVVVPMAPAEYAAI